MASSRRKKSGKRRSTGAPNPESSTPAPTHASPQPPGAEQGRAAPAGGSTNASGAGGDPRVMPKGPWRSALNLWIAALLFLFVVDAMPNSIPGLKRLNDGIDIIVDKMGLAQGEWKLFSPDPDHVNAYVEAIVTYDDGSTRVWTTPEWRDRSLITKFFQGRHPKWADALRMDRNKVVWPRLCDWVLTQVDAPEGAEPTQVELKRHWWDVPTPAELPKEEAKYAHIPPHRDEYQNHFSFHTKKYR